MTPLNAVGIDIGGTKIACALVDGEGRILAESRVPTLASEGIPAVIAQIVLAVESLGVAINAETVRGIGVGSPGHIDAEAGIVRYAGNLGWRDVPLRDLLREAIRLPIQLENDAAAALIGEHRFGAARGVADAVLLSVGTGLGASALVGGRLLRGAASFAMEVGQTRLPERDSILEQTASGLGLGALARTLRPQYPQTTLPANADTMTILSAARADDPLACAALDSMLADVAEAAVWTCSVLNPSRLILGGGMGQAVAPELLAVVRQALDTRTSPPVRDSVQVLMAQITQTALGAAALML